MQPAICFATAPSLIQTEIAMLGGGGGGGGGGQSVLKGSKRVKYYSKHALFVT